MYLREKHIGNFWAALKFFYYRKDLISLLIAIVLLFILTSGFAANQAVQKVYTAEDATIVYSSNDNCKVVITEGTITAVNGKTIRLLPGTHIKLGKNLLVNIASKECQDAVAIDVAKEEETSMLASAAIRREEVLLSITVNKTPIAVNRCDFPGQNSSVGQQNLQLAALTVTTSVSFNTPVLVLHKKNSDLNKYDSEALSSQFDFTPTFSWSEYTGTIKVMRC